MIAEALKAIDLLYNRAADKAIQTKTVDGHEFTHQALVPVVKPLPVAEPHAKAVAIHTLAGLVTYAKEKLAYDIKRKDEEADDVRGSMVHVVSHDHVLVYTDIATDDYYRRREYLAETKFAPLIGNDATPFRFGVYMDIEPMVVALQVLFVESEARASVLRFLGSIREEKVMQQDDDGVSQTVVARVGIVQNELAVAPNPVSLAPWRTFREVEQPTSAFVLRLKPGGEGSLPTAALFEADGGAWRLEAIKRIADYLRDKLPKDLTLIA